MEFCFVHRIFSLIIRLLARTHNIVVETPTTLTISDASTVSFRHHLRLSSFLFFPLARKPELASSKAWVWDLSSVLPGYFKSSTAKNQKYIGKPHLGLSKKITYGGKKTTRLFSRAGIPSHRDEYAKKKRSGSVNCLSTFRDEHKLSYSISQVYSMYIQSAST